MPFLTSLFLGFVPMLIFAGFINWLDRFEKEPKILLGVAFTWGALIAAGIAFFINTIFGVSIYALTGSESASDFATGSLIAPFVEESLKGLAVLLVFLVFRKEFDSILDGIVYASIVALGFAATENVYYIYVEGYLSDTGGGWQGLWILAFIRVILVGWQHPFYTSFFGIGLAIHRLSNRLLVKIIAPIIGFCLAVFTHSFHNTLSPILTSQLGLGGLLLGSLIDWFGWFFMFLFIIWMVFREQSILKKYLAHEVHLGTISSIQYQTAFSIFGRFKIKFLSTFSHTYRKLNKMYHLCAELAHKNRQLIEIGDEKGNSRIIQQLRDQILTLTTEINATRIG